MSAKHKRPFYVFAAVAAVCCLVLVTGMRGEQGGRRAAVRRSPAAQLAESGAADRAGLRSQGDSRRPSRPPERPAAAPAPARTATADCDDPRASTGPRPMAGDAEVGPNSGSCDLLTARRRDGPPDERRPRRGDDGRRRAATA